MGWTSFNLQQPVKEWFKGQWEHNSNDCTVLDVAIVKRNTLYAAIQDNQTKRVFAVIYLIRWSPKSWYNFSYKDMDESMGPCEYECPERIMKLLTPTEHEHAIEWRKKVENFHRMRKILLKPNTTIKLNKPVGFSNGMKFMYFKKEGKKIFAGEVQKNGIFAKFSQVRLDILYYMKSYGYEFIEA